MKNQNKETILTGLLLLALGMIIISGAYKPAMAEMELMEWNSIEYPAGEKKIDTPIVNKFGETKEQEDEFYCRALGTRCSDEFLKELSWENEISLVRQEIINQASVYNVDTQTAINIAECESTFRITAKNPVSTAKGIYQFTDPTWKWINASGHQFDYKENIKQFMIWFPVYPTWWEQCL